MGSKEEVFKRVEARHEKICRDYLGEQEVFYPRLWLAVGYFNENNRNLFSKEEWAKLLRATDRAG